MSKRVNKLLGLEIDEVSLVDRPANQHGLVAITKRDEGPVDEIYDAQGNLIDPSTLQAGDYFYTENGEEFQALTEEQVAELEGTEVPDDLSGLTQEDLDSLSDDEFAALQNSGQLAGVGKADAAITGGASSLFQTGRKIADRALGSARSGFHHSVHGSPTRTSDVNERAARTGAHVGRNRMRYGAGGVAVAGYGAGRRTTASKSLGAEVLQELSKAYTDGDRDQIVSKALEAADSRASAAERQARIAVSKAARIEEQREYETYVELAKSYELPIEADELGGILQVIAKSGLSPEQLDTVDRIFCAAGEQTLYGEVGSAGIAPSSVMEQVAARAHELVGKNDFTLEQATTALFENDDRAYLEYLAETGH